MPQADRKPVVTFFRWIVLSGALTTIAGCTGVSADSEFFGRVEPPEGQHLRYITGSEPISMDPQIGTGQPESRIYAAIFDSLTENHPQTNQPIPSIAESWEANPDNTEFIFHLRDTAQWSDGDPIRAGDFAYSWRRALSPALAAPNAYMAYHIKYAIEYNSAEVFVRDPDNDYFLLAGDDGPGEWAPDPDSFREFITGPTRRTLPGDPASRATVLAEDPALAAAVEGMEFVPVSADALGVEAVDPLTLRVTLNQPVPFFPGLTTHQFMRPVPEQAIGVHGDTAWTRPENIVTSGAYHLAEHRPYDKIVVTKSPTFWDRETARLESITFYTMEDATTMMNLYKAGEVDALYNHTVPIAWLETIRPLNDYMDAPENAIGYYVFNTNVPPFDDVRVRKAFNAAVDKDALVRFMGTGKPLTAFTPEGIYPGYIAPEGDPFDVERARALLAEAGFADEDGDYDPSRFSASRLELMYNTSETNRQVAEFVQAQWRQNLGVTIGLRNMEWQAYLEDTRTLDFEGIARRGWVGDYMDPYTFLELFATPTGNNGSGWFDSDFVDLLERANLSQDPDERYRLLARAEAMILEAQPVVPLMTSSTNWVKKPYVKGMYPNPGTQMTWKFVYIEHDPTLWDRGMPSLEPDGRYQ
jgi:oligopeptide transport system substrate-binding protein